MKFYLDLPPVHSVAGQINYREKLIFSGSCFAENIGQFFDKNHFHCLVNSHGILFNPLVISDSLRRIADIDFYTHDDLIFNQGRFYSWFHHGKITKQDAENLLIEINNNLTSAHKFLLDCRWVIITFGSAHGWWHSERNQIVANCHKMSGNLFQKKLVQSDAITDDWKKLIEKIRVLNPAVKFIFSVSPVRYIRDGLIENNRSKAELIRAVHSICEMENTIYFPAFEIVTDVLRDYRFFNEDLVHPSSQATDLVLDSFCTYLLDNESRVVVEEMKKYNRMLQHRVIQNDESEKHTNLIQARKFELMKRFSDLKWNK